MSFMTSIDAGMPNKKQTPVSPVMLLRLGLGLVFLYAGVHALVDPQSWIGFVPHWASVIIPAATFLMVHSIFELLLGVLFLVGKWWLPALSFIAAIDLGAILVLYGVDDTTFRDFGLVMAALALFLLSQKKLK